MPHNLMTSLKDNYPFVSQEHRNPWPYGEINYRYSNFIELFAGKNAGALQASIAAFVYPSRKDSFTDLR